MRKLWFSVTIKDCRVDTFRSGGKGGQNQNKVESGVRVVHPPSGAVGEARDSRDQLQNKRAAFRRMADSDTFRAWHRTEIARRISGKTVDQLVEEAVEPQNILVEGRDEAGRWVPIP